MSNRTQKDEDNYNAALRREEPIKTEVIIELRKENKFLWENMARILSALIDAEDTLKGFRLQLLEQAKRASSSDSHCVPGCRRHKWDSSDGWLRLKWTSESVEE